MVQSHFLRRLLPYLVGVCNADIRDIEAGDLSRTGLGSRHYVMRGLKGGCREDAPLAILVVHLETVAAREAQPLTIEGATRAVNGGHQSVDSRRTKADNKHIDKTHAVPYYQQQPCLT